MNLQDTSAEGTIISSCLQPYGAIAVPICIHRLLWQAFFCLYVHRHAFSEFGLRVRLAAHMCSAYIKQAQQEHSHTLFLRCLSPDSAMQQLRPAMVPATRAVADCCSTMPYSPRLSSHKPLVLYDDSHLNGASTS